MNESASPIIRMASAHAPARQYCSASHRYAPACAGRVSRRMSGGSSGLAKNRSSTVRVSASASATRLVLFASCCRYADGDLLQPDGGVAGEGQRSATSRSSRCRRLGSNPPIAVARPGGPSWRSAARAATRASRRDRASARAARVVAPPGACRPRPPAASRWDDSRVGAGIEGRGLLLQLRRRQVPVVSVEERDVSSARDLEAAVARRRDAGVRLVNDAELPAYSVAMASAIAAVSSVEPSSTTMTSRSRAFAPARSRPPSRGSGPRCARERSHSRSGPSAIAADGRSGAPAPGVRIASR